MRKLISINDLKPGYIVEESIKAHDGKYLVTKGFVLTEYTIERLKQWSDKEDILLVVNDKKEEDNRSFESKMQEQVSSCLNKIYYAGGLNLDRAIKELEVCVSHLFDDLKTIEDMTADSVKINYANNRGGHYYRLTKMALALTSLYNKEKAPRNGKISLESVGMAALLHDYGKRFQNDEEGLSKLRLDNETSRRTQLKPSMVGAPYKSEYHTVYAYLSLKGKVSEEVRKTILCCNYMDQIIMRNPETTPFRKASNIIILCDVYDTLLEYVLMNDMDTPLENVISYMNQLAHNNVLDAEIFKLFLKHVSIYPKGVKVLLSNGEYAVVVEETPEFPTRPVVLTLTPGRTTLIDLSETTNITIRSVVHTAEKDSNKVDAIHEEQLKKVQQPPEAEDCVPESLVLQRGVTNKPKALTKRFTNYLNNRNNK